MGFFVYLLIGSIEDVTTWLPMMVGAFFQVILLIMLIVYRCRHRRERKAAEAAGLQPDPEKQPLIVNTK